MGRRPGGFSHSSSEQTRIGRRLVEMIVAAVNELDRRARQLVGIDVVEQRHLDSVEFATQRLGDAMGRRADAAVFAEMIVKSGRRAAWRRPLI